MPPGPPHPQRGQPGCQSDLRFSGRARRPFLWRRCMVARHRHRLGGPAADVRDHLRRLARGDRQARHGACRARARSCYEPALAPLPEVVSRSTAMSCSTARPWPAPPSSERGHSGCAARPPLFPLGTARRAARQCPEIDTPGPGHRARPDSPTGRIGNTNDSPFTSSTADHHRKTVTTARRAAPPTEPSSRRSRPGRAPSRAWPA